MTFKDYILNPIADSGAVIGATTREFMRTSYTKKFNDVLMRENGKLDYTMYHHRKENAYIIHLKIPSETVRKFYYDVVLRFTADASIKDAGRSLDMYNVQFFSNDPAFVYSYAHVFINRGLFVTDLSSKMSTKAKREAPKEKNPQNLVGYVKSFYFAYLFMQQRGLFKSYAWGKAESYSKNKLLQVVENADEKIANRVDEGKKISRKKQRDAESSDAKKASHTRLLSKDGLGRMVKTTGTVKSVRTTKSSGGLGNVRKTKTTRKLK